MKKVEIYTKSYSPYCQRAKELLLIKGVPFVEHDITTDPEGERQMREHFGSDAVPGILVDGVPLGGCTELFELDESGELDRILDL